MESNGMSENSQEIAKEIQNITNRLRRVRKFPSSSQSGSFIENYQTFYFAGSTSLTSPYQTAALTESKTRSLILSKAIPGFKKNTRVVKYTSVSHRDRQNFDWQKITEATFG